MSLLRRACSAVPICVTLSASPVQWASSLGTLPDVMAGIVVALVLVPQSMAYAQLAGMPPHYGLYASLHADILIGRLGDSAIGGEYEGSAFLPRADPKIGAFDTGR